VVNATKLNSASGGLVKIAVQIARYITAAIPNVGTGAPTMSVSLSM